MISFGLGGDFQSREQGEVYLARMRHLLSLDMKRHGLRTLVDIFRWVGTMYYNGKDYRLDQLCAAPLQELIKV